MTNHDWSRKKLDSIVAWYGMVNFDPSAPAREDIVLEIDPSSAKGRILVTFQDLFDIELEPRDAANRLRNLVLDSGGKEATMTAWQFMIGSIARASHFFEHDTIARLVETVLELSRQPDSLPYHPIFGENATAVKPDDLAFSQLPGLGLLLYESVQGPRQYICNLQDVTFQARLAAQRRFKNVNIFVAMLTHIYLLGATCQSMNFAHVGLPAIPLALEGENLASEHQDQSTVKYDRIGDPAILYLPAAIQWINVAGREMFQYASRSPTVVSSSSKTGTFGNQLRVTGCGDLGPELSDAAIKAADNLAVILE